MEKNRRPPRPATQTFSDGRRQMRSVPLLTVRPIARRTTKRRGRAAGPLLTAAPANFHPLGLLQ